MKIAHIVCTYPPYYGGMGNSVFEMASRMGDRGHEIEVLTPQYYEEKEMRSADAPPAKTHAPELAQQIEHVERLAPSLQYGNAARLPQIGHELDQFDLVHLHYPFFGTANLVRKWKMRNRHKPLVITYHMDSRAIGWKGLIFKGYAAYWMPRILGSADLLIGSSFDYIKSSDAREVYESKPEKWIELPFGVDIDRFQPRSQPVELFEEIGLSPDLQTVLFVGGMDVAHEFKGVPVLLNALLIAKKSGIKLQAIFVGDGELRSEFEARAKVYGLGESVRFLGRVEHDLLPYVYNAADVFVLPSIHRGEAFGMVLLEAMASGVPVIATDIPGVRTVAKDGGMVVPPKNAMALADAIMNFVTRDDRNFIGLSVRQRAEEKYSWELVVDRLCAEYERLV